jgi:hypothetical protein
MEADPHALADSGLRPSLEFALLADAVQAVEGKLYVLGGGWDTLLVGRFPVRHHTLAIGLRLRVPWSSESQSVRFTVGLQDADGVSLLPNDIHHKVDIKPRASDSRQDFGVVRSVTFNNLTFKKAGDYSFVITLDDEVVHRLRFTVKQRP